VIVPVLVAAIALTAFGKERHGAEFGAEDPSRTR
jgi:hypothetical protein